MSYLSKHRPICAALQEIRDTTTDAAIIPIVDESIDYARRMSARLVEQRVKEQQSATGPVVFSDRMFDDMGIALVTLIGPLLAGEECFYVSDNPRLAVSKFLFVLDKCNIANQFTFYPQDRMFQHHYSKARMRFLTESDDDKQG